jgi:cob(I)alamin adenosyltransferase
VKAYTGGGDQGRTSLLSGERVAKSHCRVEACGDVDELSSTIGALLAALPPDQRGLRDELLETQADLFRLGARLATAPGSAASAMLPRFGVEQVRRLEAAIDGLEAGLPALQGFILPGGHPSAAWAHLARTVCRRAERRVVECTLASSQTVQDEAWGDVIAYLNRLSTYLFSVARQCNRIFSVTERTWQA